MTNALTPLIRWAGSKRKLLPKLTPYWMGTTGKYVEPFAGSAALFFSLAPSRAVLGDINPELLTTYRAIVQFPRQVYEAATTLRRSKRVYIQLRKVQPLSLGIVERAARFLFLNRHCFNGIYRTNLQGNFNVPYAPASAGSFPPWTVFEAAARQLSNAVLVQADFQHLLRRYVSPGDFVYLDPPYAVGNRRMFHQYGPDTFGLADLARLADCLHALDALGARFLLSYAYCPEALFFFGQWQHRRVYTHRNISGFAKHRRRAAEVLVTNCQLR